MKRHKISGFTKKIFPVFVFLFISINLFSNITDSLWAVYNNSKNDSTRILTLINLAEKLQETHSDSTIKLIIEAGRLVDSIEVFEYAEIYQQLAMSCNSIGLYNESGQYYKKSAEIFHMRKKFEQSALILLTLSYDLTVRGYFHEAISQLMEIQNYCDKYNLELSRQRCMLIFGFAYRSFNQDKALEYFQKCASLCGRDTLVNDMNYALNEIGNIYVVKKEFEKAIPYLFRSLKIREKIGSKILLSYSYHDIASLYTDMGKYDEALSYFFKSEEYTSEINDLWGLSITYANISRLYCLKKSFFTAKNYLDKAFILADKIDIKPVYQELYMQSYNLFLAQKDFENALNSYQIYIAYSDSIYMEEKQREISLLEIKFNSARKDKELADQKNQIKNQRLLMYSGLIIILMIIFVAVLIWRQYRNKRKLNEKLMEINAEILTKNEEISAQRDEIEAQRDEITLQRDLVISQKNQLQNVHEELTSSIRYAQNIQNAVLLSTDEMKEILGDHFIIFQPRDIVSGDFYWATKMECMIIFCVADCTGHGVPGAFMSLMGISFLNEIVMKEKMTNPAEILNKLRQEVVITLRQKINNSENKEVSGMKDGMDISLCCLNTETGLLQFAGAYNPLFLITKKHSKTSESIKTDPSFYRKDELNDLVIFEIKGDKMPIGIHLNMNPFTLHEFYVEKSDCLYLLSDGYADQFGGFSKETGGQKYKSKPLKKMLMKNNHLNIADQKKILENNLIAWRTTSDHYYDQVDDITIIGIRI
ncbi:MAG: SpoIIE family protein phosphatase [Bacteroidota bacterium]